MHLEWYGLCCILGKIEKKSAVLGFRKGILSESRSNCLVHEAFFYQVLIFILGLIFVALPTIFHLNAKHLKVSH